MPFTVPAEGENFLVELLTKTALSVSANWRLRLYVNDETIGADTVLADLDEASFDGYAPFELPRSDWSDPVQVSGRATVQWEPGVLWFECVTGSEDIYGWFVTDADDTVILFGDRLPGAPVTCDPSNPIPLTPVLRLTSEYPPIV